MPNGAKGPVLAEAKTIANLTFFSTLSVGGHFWAGKKYQTLDFQGFFVFRIKKFFKTVGTIFILIIAIILDYIHFL